VTCREEKEASSLGAHTEFGARGGEDCGKWVGGRGGVEEEDGAGVSVGVSGER